MLIESLFQMVFSHCYIGQKSHQPASLFKENFGKAQD